MSALPCFFCNDAVMVESRIHPKVYVHDCPKCGATCLSCVVTGEDGESREMKVIGALLEHTPAEKGGAK